MVTNRPLLVSPDGGNSVTTTQVTLNAKPTGASNNRHRSTQNVGTPPELLDAVRDRFGELTFDLAASHENAVCAKYFTEYDDALVQSWPTGLNWLNPPFGNIGAWVKKAYAESQLQPHCRVIMLVPASVSTNWYRDYVDGKAYCIPIRRVKFVGHDQVFPKDMMLIVYGSGMTGWGSQWDWRMTSLK